MTSRARKKLLLLHDTAEKDLARDLREFLELFELEVVMIVDSPELDATLQNKENQLFKGVSAAVFLLTKGATRAGVAYPSPSVTHEMGQAQQLFMGAPGLVVYLLEHGCSVPAIDQKPYVQFDRSDMRSVLGALIKLVATLRASGVILAGETALPEKATQPSPGIDVRAVAGKISDEIKAVAEDMSGQLNGMFEYIGFTKHLQQKYGMDMQRVNFLLGDLQTHGLAQYYPPKQLGQYAFFGLTSLGWQVVRHEVEKRRVPPWTPTPEEVLAILKQMRTQRPKS